MPLQQLFIGVVLFFVLLVKTSVTKTKTVFSVLIFACFYRSSKFVQLEPTGGVLFFFVVFLYFTAKFLLAVGIVHVTFRYAAMNIECFCLMKLFNLKL
jgi:hypothetical protein